MTTLIILILIGVIFAAIAKKAKNDKTQHVFAGYSIAWLTACLAYYFFPNLTAGVACIIGALTATLIGAAKELIWDKWLGKGTCSLWDFLATSFGGVSGAIILRVVYAIINGEGIGPGQ